MSNNYLYDDIELIIEFYYQIWIEYKFAISKLAGKK